MREMVPSVEFSRRPRARLARRVKYAPQRMDLCGRFAGGGGDVTEGRLKRLERNWSRGGSNLNLETKGLKTMDESANHFVLITAVEVIGAEILVGNTFSEHEVNGCEHRGGDGDDGLLRAAPALEPLELGSQVREEQRKGQVGFRSTHRPLLPMKRGCGGYHQASWPPASEPHQAVDLLQASSSSMSRASTVRSRSPRRTRWPAGQSHTRLPRLVTAWRNRVGGRAMRKRGRHVEPLVCASPFRLLRDALRRALDLVHPEVDCGGPRSDA